MPHPSDPNLWRAVLLIVVAALGAYYNSYSCQFVLDDNRAILTNPSIRHLWPLGPVLKPPAQEGETVGGRPLLNLSLAINYALNRTSVFGYHAVNLAIHVLAALAMLGVLRRTFLLPCMGGRFNTTALGMATAIALLWTVHPAQTESVTYICQRAESMMGLFYLLTLYCVIRSSDAGDWRWPLAAVLSCALGMASKEVMVTAPVMVLLYDRTFLSGSFAQALRKRWRLYIGLAACWGLLACEMIQAGSRGETAGAGKYMLDVRTYALTQFGVILHYLKVSFWPHPLCVYWFGWPGARTASQILPGAIAVAAIAVATIRGLTGGRKWGFLGAWFLVILAPTSTVVPILSPIFEHRVYLSLAAAMTLVVLAATLLWQRLLKDKGWFAGQDLREQWRVPTVAAVAIVIGLAFLTTRRNLDYRSMATLWQDIAAKADLWGNEAELMQDTPDVRKTYSGINNELGYWLASSNSDLALKCIGRAIRLDPKNDEAYINYGVVLHMQKDLPGAIRQFRQAIEVNPKNVGAHYRLGTLLCQQGNAEEGLALCRQAVGIDPQNLKAANALGLALCGLGNTDEGMAQFRQIIASHPDDAEAYFNMGLTLAKQGKTDQAIEQLHKAITVNPRYMPAYKPLFDLLNKSGRSDEAAEVQDQAQDLMHSDTPP